MKEKSFAIVGGGICGLTLAIALQKNGYNVKVYEGAAEMKPLGAGLALAANAVRSFQQIGISESVLEAGKVLKVLKLLDINGNTLTQTDSEAIAKKLGIVNNFTIHRADLHRVLLSQLTTETVVLNKRCTGFEKNNHSVIATFSDGTSVQHDALIACDGIHSAVRKQLINDSTPRYAGYTCFRAVINDPPAKVNMEQTTETWGPGKRFGIVPLSNNRLYWFACINTKQNDPEMKSMTVDRLLQYFSGFHSPVPEIIRHTTNEQLIWNDIVDIAPLKQFAFDKVLLMGDAAHATTPNLGQGACMAIEDAAVLLACLEESATPEGAFDTFQKKRIRKTTRVVKGSWRLGKLAQLENSFLISLRNIALRLTPEKFAEKQIKSLLVNS